jgi:hypothetical protein
VKYFSDLEAKVKKKTGETLKILTITNKLDEIPDLEMILTPNYKILSFGMILYLKKIRRKFVSTIPEV